MEGVCSRVARGVSEEVTFQPSDEVAAILGEVF